MRNRIFTLLTIFGLLVSSNLYASVKGERKMWASIMNVGNASLGGYKDHTGKLLLSWRMLPTDKWDTKFYLYRGGGTLLTRVTSSPINATNYQVSSVPTAKTMFYLASEDFYTQLGMTKAPVSINSANLASFKAIALDSVLIDSRLYSEKLPYLTIPLKSTEDVSSLVDEIKYQANDCSVADLDGDGGMEVVVKRLLTVYNKTTGEIKEDFIITYKNNALRDVFGDALIDKVLTKLKFKRG